MERLNENQLNVIDCRLLEWYYEQSLIRHQDLVRTESVITERGYTLFAIYFAILSASVGYVLTHLDVRTDVALTSGCLSLIVFSCISIGYVCKVIWPHTFFAPGRKPDDFSIPAYISYFQAKNISSELQKKQVVADELVELQRKITEQERCNTLRVEYTSCSIKFLLLGTFMAVAAFLSAFFI